VSCSQLATRVCPAKPSRRSLKPPRANHVTTAVPANSVADVDSSCFTGNASSFPVTHGIATAVEQTVRDVPQDPAVAALKRSLQLDVNWRGHSVELHAPLASPEPLSETSSLASYGSDSFRRQLSGDRRWISRAAVRMDPIKQSPLCRSSPPSTRLIVSSSQSGAVTGLCFPVDELQQSSEAESEQEVNLCLATQDVSGAAPLPSMYQTVVEVHHHQDSPTQHNASKSMSEFVSEQTDDNISVELFSVDTPSALVIDSAVSGDTSVVLRNAQPGSSSLANECCLHAVSECGCDRFRCSGSVTFDDDGHLIPLPEAGAASVAESRSSLLPHIDDTSDDMYIVDSGTKQVDLSAVENRFC